MRVWYERLCSTGSRRHGERFEIDAPIPAVTTVGIGGAGAGGGDWYWLRDDRPERRPRMIDKPAYRVPTMAEINARPWNGFTVVSTFSGAGGSSLGYRMAGFRVAWVNEFVEAARETYRANARPETIIDGRDIREITGAEILHATGLKPGELDVLDGSPPCASFSTAGKREKAWGTVKKYSDVEQRADDLFFEFARLLGELRPRTFVAENVSGLVMGTAKGYFLSILGALKSTGYVVAARMLDAQWLGVPQQRRRLIFVGVRDDLDAAPAHPAPLPYRYSIRDALPWLVDGAEHPPVEDGAQIARFAIGAEWDKAGHGGKSDKYLNLVRGAIGRPAPTITATGGNSSAAGPVHPTEKRKFAIAELRRLCGFPDDFVLTGSYAQQWERLGRAVPPPMMERIATTLRDDILRRL